MEIQIRAFEDFRKKYPGRKRGYSTELQRLQKHKDWEIVLSELMPALERELDWRLEMRHRGGFVPEWKHLQTWLNQRCWEDEQPQITGGKKTLEEKIAEIWAN